MMVMVMEAWHGVNGVHTQRRPSVFVRRPFQDIGSATNLRRGSGPSGTGRARFGTGRAALSDVLGDPKPIPVPSPIWHTCTFKFELV